MNLLSVTGKKWLFKKFDTSDVRKISEEHSLTEIVAKLISIRKKDIDNISLYLNPKIKNFLPNPFRLKDMKSAVDRVYTCIKKNQPIGVFGDYDVDGASSTAMLVRYFNLLNLKIHKYIPDRSKEGYGPNIEAFNKLINTGVKLILTVDCGTLSFEPIKLAKNKETDVIVIDHHQSDTKLPDALAIINPNRYDDDSGLNYLCAAGVCFVFLVALNKKLRDENWFNTKNVAEPNILNFLDLVSLGTVCDVVPLIGLNRAIVKQGLQIIKKRSNLGIKILFDLCNIQSQPTTYDIGFKLGPRINAGGRVGKSSHGAELLISNDPSKAYQIATDLEKSNKERQSIEYILSEKIFSIIEKDNNDPVIVLSGNEWHEGIIGIVASRIKDKYNKPTILISLNKNTGKGSARSITGFDIGAQIIKAVQLKILEKGGGHKMAGGFTLKKENISVFKDFLIKNFEKIKTNANRNLNMYIDAIIAPSAINEDFLHEINCLAPFGSGNSEPKFAIEDLKVLSSNIVANNHIKSILCGKDGSVFKAFTWNGINSPLEPFLIKKNKKNINIAGKMRLNEWRGKRIVEFMIEDIILN